ncbi:MAG: hypothetical protein O7D31_12785 [Alphaproteobacteria bacterium]|nr:hypothetical protein [Alphaproteobacteria bacterium]
MDMDEKLVENQRFLRETEQAIRITNIEVIHKQLPPITSERILTFSLAVAKLRAEYIEAAFTFADTKHADGAEGAADINELGLCRRRFEEARDAIIALQRAIELGYVAVE